MSEGRKVEGGFRVVLLGPPGAGKGTQAPAIRKEYNLCHLATGDMLRAAVAAKTDLGVKAKTLMEEGKLVPDDLVVNIIKENIHTKECQHGFVLDGFPRTEGQAKKLDEMLSHDGTKLDHVLHFVIDDNLLIRRITGRLSHNPSGRVYHEEFNPPKVPMKDDVTGEPLTRRSDDNADTLKTRLATYHAQTAPVAKYYKESGVYSKVDASLGTKTVYENIKAIFFSRS
jgi:adenylate kinase